MAPDVAPGAGAASEYARLSLWWEAVPLPLPVRPALAEDLQVDVCIVGAGFTGLWTAHALALADPTLRIAVLEREVAGFGASGRNGGWCSALFATSDSALVRRHGIDAMRAMRHAMQETVDVVGASAAERGHRLPLREGRHRRPGAQRGPEGAGARRSRIVAVARVRRRRSPLARPGGGARVGGSGGDDRRHLHAPLCGDPAGPPRPWPRRRSRTTWCAPLRAHRGARHPSRRRRRAIRRDPRRHRPRRRGRAGH